MVGTPPPKREARVRFSAEPAKGRCGAGERIERTREREIEGGLQSEGRVRRGESGGGGVRRGESEGGGGVERRERGGRV